MSGVWFSWDELTAVTGGTWLAPGPAAAAAAGVSAVVDDSRGVRRGALFVAIRGETADGHRFVLPAAEAGAVAACVQGPPAAAELARLQALGCAVLQVPDTLAAFQSLACAHRRRQPAVVVVGITGSSGKTSTKEMLAAVLDRRFPGAVLKTEGNTNNHFGVPRNLLRLAGGHRAAVIEMGSNHPGEIAALARLAQPEIGVVSNLGAAHLEYFGDLAGVAREKGDLLAGIAATGIAVFHGDAPHADLLRAKAGRRRALTFGTAPGNDVVVHYLGACPAGSHVRLDWPREGQHVEVAWGLRGAHQALNAGAAAAVGRALGLSPAEIAAGLGQVTLPGMRMECRQVAGTHWINDAYNANPDSMQAGIESFLELAGAAPAAARLLVLGDMLEQGAQAPAVHLALLHWLRRRDPGAEVVVVGPCFSAVATDLGIQAFADAESAAVHLRARATPGRWVFLKGSRGLRLERLLPPAAEATP